MRTDDKLEIGCGVSVAKLKVQDFDTFIIRVDLKPERVNVR